MFNKQKNLDLNKETKILITTDNAEHSIVQTLEKKLNITFKALDNDTTTMVHTLGNIQAEAVMVIAKEGFADKKKRQTIIETIMKLKKDALLLLDTFEAEDIALLFEGLTCARYRFDRFKSNEKDDMFLLAYHTENAWDAAIHEGIVIGEAINHTRELINTPYNYLNAQDLADYAESLSAIDNMNVKIYEKADCEAMNMGAFLGVNKGSKDAPKLIYIEYNGNPNSKDKTALVGKGVMYDTGGYSLKTTQGMPSMKCDMGGAATVLGAIEAIARMELKHNVSVVIAATDNRIGDEAMVPDDIITAANGTTIEIISTDAEGRLTLADALWFAQKEGATHMIDAATLTGAVVVALGKTYVGAFTNNKPFLNTVLEVAEKQEEKIWELPIDEEYHETLKSTYADIKNSGGRIGGASVAAAFLDKFVETEVPWIHLDIAGTAYDEKTGATGRVVKTLVKLFQ